MKQLLVLATLALAVEASAITGDLNLDGVVDFDDFFIFTDNFGKSGSPSSADCGGYDPDIAPGGEPALLTDVSMANEGSAYVVRISLKDRDLVFTSANGTLEVRVTWGDGERWQVESDDAEGPFSAWRFLILNT